jgi:hypothetical protein
MESQKLKPPEPTFFNPPAGLWSDTQAKFHSRIRPVLAGVFSVFSSRMGRNARSDCYENPRQTADDGLDFIVGDVFRLVVFPTIAERGSFCPHSSGFIADQLSMRWGSTL